MRWITFDQETYSALRSAYPAENVFEFPARSPLQYALESQNSVVAVLPGGPHDAALVTFRRARVAQFDPIALPTVANTRAGGILGLRDEPEFQHEEIQEKRNWWRRFWDY
jgi:hypothetical protein